MTAIAAVLAFSSTPLLAQDVTSTPDPVADTTVDTQPPAADPLAPDEVAPAATVASEAAPAKATPKPKASVTKRVTTTTTTKTASPVRATAEPVAAPPVEPAVPVPAPEAMAPPPATPIAPAVEPAPADQANVMDDVLPVAGGTALGLLAIAGAAMAMRRRKRRDEDEEFAERQAVLAEVEAEPVTAVAEPAFVRASQPVHDPIPATGPVTELPDEFDLSRFGRHVQAAYRGPTADNPSLSLKNRLRRASFFDQQERKAAEVAAERRVADLPRARENAGSDFMLRRAGTKVPAYQH